jgi:hypothetical protein
MNRRFVVALGSHEVPKEPFGRVTRFVFDVDTDAVRDYVMFEGRDTDTPWPAVVISELLAELTLWAQREEFISSLPRTMPRLAGSAS